MPVKVGKHTIKRVLIVDDNEEAREGFGYPLEDLGLQAVPIPGPLHDVNRTLQRFRTQGDAVVCDYHLRKKNYADFNGDQLVAASNRISFPALLCTTYTDTEVTLMRVFRRYIPVLLTPDTYTPESLVEALKRCVNENSGVFGPSRKPWRTLVRIDEVDKSRKYFYVVLPGWSAEQKVRIYFQDIPKGLRSIIRAGKRLHAQVNLGAEKAEELFFDDWERE